MHAEQMYIAISTGTATVTSFPASWTQCIGLSNLKLVQFAHWYDLHVRTASLGLPIHHPHRSIPASLLFSSLLSWNVGANVKPPFYATRIAPGYFGIKGSVPTDKYARL
jgi:hypothetical protein